MNLNERICIWANLTLKTSDTHFIENGFTSPPLYFGIQIVDREWRQTKKLSLINLVIQALQIADWNQNCMIWIDK